MKDKYKLLLILANIIFISSSSCTSFNFPIFGCANTTTNPSIPLQDLLSYPETVEIESNKFVAQVSLSIDQSIGNNLNRCMTGTINITNKNNLKLPLSYKIEHFWLINGKNVWETNSIVYTNKGEITFIGGPNSTNDGQYAVIKLINNQGRSFLIKASKVYIERII